MVIQNSEGSFIKRVNELIEVNLKDEGFGVSELAREMNMSRSNLHRIIKSSTGKTVSQFIRNKRLNKAQELLGRDYLTVAEVGYLTGFRSATYFSKCFRIYFGYPPVEAKKRAIDLSEKSRNLMNGFPVQTTSFIGRKKEIETIVALIEKHRIVTLTGTGGCGKTRLACELVEHVGKDYKDGIWFVDLAPVREDTLVIRQLMATLGLPEVPGKEMMDTVTEKIRNQKLFIVLDNCEHLIRTCAMITQRLTESTPGLSLLITSRETLNINGEKVWRVPSLSLTDPTIMVNVEQAKRSEAVCLFTDRAKLSNSGFVLVEENASTVSTICHRLDGIPLAIELVASRSRHLDTKTMLHRLSERFDTLPSMNQGIIDRHRTLETTIEWSYNLLSEDEKALFRQLSVFTGGFDLTAAEEICSTESLSKDIILDLLSQLVDKSMIQTIYMPGQPIRYKLFETLQRFASKLHIQLGQVHELRKRHLNYFTKLAQMAYQNQFESQSTWMNKLKLENDNLHYALNWAEPNHPEGFRILAGYIPWYWALVSGSFLSGRSYLERALSIGSDDTETHARLLCGLGYLCYYFNDREKVIDLLNESLSLWQRLKNPFEESVVWGHLSASYQAINRDTEKAVMTSKRSLKLARELDQPGIEINALQYLCRSLVHSKQFRKALPYVKELLTSSDSLNQSFGIVTAYHYRADCALGLKNFIDAEKKYGLATKTAQKHGIMVQAYADLQGIAFALSGQSRWAKSIRINAAALESFKSIGFEVYGIWPMWDDFIDTYIDGAKKQVGENLAKQYEEEGVAMGFDKALEYALDFNTD